jgi:NADH dehydrogenase FAD-containing subunit
LHAYGATPRGDIVRTVSTDLYNANTNSIRVKNTLQVADGGYPKIFAAGDVADTGDLKMAYKAGLHGPIIAKNILSLIKGQAATAVYKPTTDSELMVIPLGKTGGVTYISYFGGTVIRSTAHANCRLHTWRLGDQNAQRKDFVGS